MDLALLQSLSYITSMIGVIGTLTVAFIGVRTYINSNKRAEEARKRELDTQELALKSQQQNLETRQAQLFMQILLVNQSKELAESWFKLYSMNLSNPKEIAERGWVKGDPELHELVQLVAVVATHYDGIGLYAKKGLIDIDMVRELLLGDYLMMWEKLRPLILEVRKVTPFSADNFEWLYDRLRETQVIPSVPS